MMKTVATVITRSTVHFTTATCVRSDRFEHRRFQYCIPCRGKEDRGPCGGCVRLGFHWVQIKVLRCADLILLRFSKGKSIDAYFLGITLPTLWLRPREKPFVYS